MHEVHQPHTGIPVLQHGRQDAHRRSSLRGDLSDTSGLHVDHRPRGCRCNGRYGCWGSLLLLRTISPHSHLSIFIKSTSISRVIIFLARYHPERHPQAHASPRLNLSRRPSSSSVSRKGKGRSSNHLTNSHEFCLPMSDSGRSSASKTSGWQGGVPAKLSRSMCLV